MFAVSCGSGKAFVKLRLDKKGGKRRLKLRWRNVSKPGMEEVHWDALHGPAYSTNRLLIIRVWHGNHFVLAKIRTIWYCFSFIVLVGGIRRSLGRAMRRYHYRLYLYFVFRRYTKYTRLLFKSKCCQHGRARRFDAWHANMLRVVSPIASGSRRALSMC